MNTERQIPDSSKYKTILCLVIKYSKNLVVSSLSYVHSHEKRISAILFPKILYFCKDNTYFTKSKSFIKCFVTA